MPTASRRCTIALLLCSAFARSQEETPAPQDQFFSGTITEVSADRVTVSRTVLGKDSGSRTFLITSETRIEGKPRVKSRVTVRFVAAEDGDRAIHIIVRAPSKK